MNNLQTILKKNRIMKQYNSHTKVRRTITPMLNMNKAESLVATSIGQRPMVWNMVCNDVISPLWGFGLSAYIHSIWRCHTLLIVRLSALNKQCEFINLTKLKK